MGVFRRSKEGPDLFGNGDTPSLQSRDFVISKTESKPGVTDHIRDLVAPALKREVDLEPLMFGSPDGQKPRVVDFGGRLLVGGWYRGGDNGGDLAVLGGPSPAFDGPEKVAA